MAVGRRLEQFNRADRVHPAGLVLNDHLPALAVRQRVGDDAPQDVRRRRDDARSKCISWSRS